MDAIFRAKVDENGVVRWANRNEAMEFFRSIAGKRITITIGPGRRTPGQNRKVHAVFAEFCERTGYAPAAAKAYLKDEYIADGRGTSELNVDECEDFIAFCEAWVAVHLG